MTDCVIQMWHMFDVHRQHGSDCLHGRVVRTRVPRVLYKCLVLRLIKDKFKSVHAYVGMFEDIDKQI